MKASRRWNPRLGVVSLCAVMLVLHAILKEILARHDVVSSLFAAGPHVPRGYLGVAVVFAGVRLFVFLAIPALLAGRLVVWMFTRGAAWPEDEKARGSCWDQTSQGRNGEPSPKEESGGGKGS